jgi:hypothetical protein
MTGQSRDGRVEDGRGSLGRVATLRFPFLLIEPDVRISRREPTLAGHSIEREHPIVQGFNQ